MNFNKAIVLGNVTKDIELKTLPSGQPVANFGVATNRFYTDKSGQKQQTAEFHNVVAFGKLAEICSRYLNKGKLVLVEGRIQTRSWQAQDGSKRYRTEIIMENMQLGPRSSGADSGTPTSAPASPTAPAEEQIPVIDADETLNFGNDEEQSGVNVKDIPF
ncbi:single-stranded DNA-binding protein [Patescibacteria group bacterium]|nr:single-stranded DNA-binding protein [Patescibacteria group bacterium]MBU2219842.1 single-stranded DNA-binding protein [Patescibacteria group bacterium]MBU2264903.1 single-stranded DNA-binding protein [Patescibacteria group bacterium]